MSRPLLALIFLNEEVCWCYEICDFVMSVQRLQIVRDGFDSRLEPIAFDIIHRMVPASEELKLTSQSPSIY